MLFFQTWCDQKHMQIIFETKWMQMNSNIFESYFNKYKKQKTTKKKKNSRKENITQHWYSTYFRTATVHTGSNELNNITL